MMGYNRIKMPQLIIIAFLLALIAMAWLLQMDMAILFNESKHQPKSKHI
jgi:hypothetical protein